MTCQVAKVLKNLDIKEGDPMFRPAKLQAKICQG